MSAALGAKGARADASLALAYWHWAFLAQPAKSVPSPNFERGLP